MRSERKNMQCYETDFLSSVEALFFISVDGAVTETKYLSVVLNPQNLNVTKNQNLNVTKKTLTGFCMVQLACLSQQSFASDERDIAMRIKRNNEIGLVLIFLTFFATNGFAYSQKALTISDDAEIKIVKTKWQSSAYSTVSRSPDVINNLRLMFSSNKKNKVQK